MKVLITGGHFSPAYSIIEELKKRGHMISVAGRMHPFEGDKSISFEYQVCQKENLEFHEIKAGRYQRKFSSYTLLSLLKTPFGFFSSITLLKKVRPDVVMTFGGYIGLPIAYAAAFLKIPVVLHEQTQEAGLASRQIGFVARRVCISFKSSFKYFPKSKTTLTGNPIRPEVLKIEDKISLPSGKVLYITGGSTGSHFINTIIGQVLPDLLDKYVLIHQTGENNLDDDFARLSELRNSLDEEKKKRYILRKFIFPSEIGSVFASADLIVSRSGANTVFEIFATEKMSLLIPLPHGQNNEQLLNAKLVANLGIGEYIAQDKVNSQALQSKISKIFKDEKAYKSNMKKAKDFVIPKASEGIVDIIEQLENDNKT